MSKVGDAEATFMINDGGGEGNSIEEKHKNKEKPEKSKIWKRIPCFGLILIVVKNIIGGAQDVVVKKITGIG